MRRRNKLFLAIVKRRFKPSPLAPSHLSNSPLSVIARRSPRLQLKQSKALWTHCLGRARAGMHRMPLHQSGIQSDARGRQARGVGAGGTEVEEEEEESGGGGEGGRAAARRGKKAKNKKRTGCVKERENPLQASLVTATGNRGASLKNLSR